MSCFMIRVSGFGVRASCSVFNVQYLLESFLAKQAHI